MNIRKTVLINGIIIVLTLCFSFDCYGQVDPRWLKSWKKAEQSRPANLTSSKVITEPREPGIPLVINGQVFKPNGSEVAIGVVIHIYHRDHAGYDFGKNDNSLETWRLQGWAKSDSKGKFKFYTIKPAPDHMGREGSHIHFTTVSSEYGKQWAPKIFLIGESTDPDKPKKRIENFDRFSTIKKTITIDGIQHMDINIKLKESADF